MFLLVIFIFQRIPDCHCNLMPRIFSAIQNEKTAIIQDSTNILIRNIFHINFTEDGLLDFNGLSKKYIRPAEEYDVVTEDGYILKLFRIPGNKSKVVLICHGLLMTSDSFLLRGNISLIAMLAEQDYDIWVMNFRGNTYSRRHVTLNPDIDREFWQYYMQEMGIYDYTASIDFILKQTGQANLSIVGHSEGGAAFFVLMSEKPEYNKKVNVFVGMAPACYIGNAGIVTKAMANITPKLSSLLRILGIEEIAAFHSLLKKVSDMIFLSQGRTGYEFYFHVVGAVAGHVNTANIEMEFIPTILGHVPAGSGLKNIEHFGHLYIYNRFCKYDNDFYIRNFVASNSMPPDYDLNKVTTNVALFAAKNDLLVGLEDVKRLRNNLPNVVHFQVVSDDTYNHMDYLWARNAQTVLYPDVIDILNKYNN